MLLFTVFRSPLCLLCQNFIKVTMVFIREIHFSSLVQKIAADLRLVGNRSTVRASHRRSGQWTDGQWVSLMWFITAAVVAACIVIRPPAQCDVLSAPSIFTARRYAMSDYAMVALCLCVCLSQVAVKPITVVCKAARVYVPIIGGVVWTFYRVLCKNGWTDRRQSLKPTPIHAKCRYMGLFNW